MMRHMPHPSHHAYGCLTGQNPQILTSQAEIGFCESPATVGIYTVETPGQGQSLANDSLIFPLEELPK